MDLIHGELEHFIMLEEETVTQMFRRLMLLVLDIRTLGKKMLRALTPRNPTLDTMIRRDPSFKTKTPNQLLGEILHQELVERYVAKSLSMRMNNSLALNASSTKNEESSEGSTDEEITFAIRNYKKFLKKNAFKKFGEDRKKTSKRRCYECKEVGHFIADCLHKKKKEFEDKRFKDKSKDYKKKYQGQAHVGQEWDSSDDEDNKKGMATLAILNPTTPTKLFNNFFDNEDDTPFCLMAKGAKLMIHVRGCQRNLL
ncbi:hypothetical protein SETIT_8G106800v2 [Setaria italica]|uniref:CCHC-type domain-containing protein n=1 Tax=Setaria italica TaxID=4555 RepID=K3ZLL7_SETIT|nr:hypothetical protein SETIT_8G106800v2 [Setaria italica]